jgi:hypothetical protein
LEFRQAIEKQLNKGENSNKFSKAVSFGNNMNFCTAKEPNRKSPRTHDHTATAQNAGRKRAKLGNH